MTIEELREKIRLHGLWLANDPRGSRANLRGAYLREADLQRADLQGAYLQGANLQGANLQRAYLQRAYLQGADLQGADLHGADLQETYLQGADFDLADIIHRFSIVPESGAFTAYKQARSEDETRIIVKLEIPASAKRLGGLVGRKCRVSKAGVVSLTLVDGAPYKGESHSMHDHDFKYIKGTTVEVLDFCEDAKEECAKGINLFLTRREAVEYVWAPSQSTLSASF